MNSHPDLQPLSSLRSPKRSLSLQKPKTKNQVSVPGAPINTIDPSEKICSVYTAHSKHNFYARKMISAFVLKENKLPLNPFTNWDYFMNDMVERNLTVRANNNLIYLADELWQFGIISNGCYHEIKLAMDLKKNLRFFTIGKTSNDIKEVDLSKLQFEQELIDEYDVSEFLDQINQYLARHRA